MTLRRCEKLFDLDLGSSIAGKNLFSILRDGTAQNFQNIKQCRSLTISIIAVLLVQNSPLST